MVDIFFNDFIAHMEYLKVKWKSENKVKARHSYIQPRKVSLARIAHNASLVWMSASLHSLSFEHTSDLPANILGTTSQLVQDNFASFSSKSSPVKMARYELVGLFDCTGYAKADKIVDEIVAQNPCIEFNKEMMDHMHWKVRIKRHI